MTDPTLHDARTSAAAVWSLLENLKGEALAAWRVADVDDRPTSEARNLAEPYPFGWYAVCYGDELAAGQVKGVRYLGRELVVWRGEDGRARVLDAFCRHLGAHMAYGGRVKGDDLECPFHAWQYDGSGAVTHIPYADEIPARAREPNCVRGWPVVERNGLVWIWYHPDNRPPLWDVVEYPEAGAADWTPFEKYEWRVFNTIRHLHDNAVDIAHFHYVHRTAVVPESELTFDGHAMTGVQRAKLGTPRGLVDGTITSRSVSPGQSSVRFEGISETLLVSAITPVAPDELHVRFAFTQPKAQASGPGAGLAKALIRDICKQFDQDKVIWDRQRHETKPLLCDGDGPVMLARYRYDQFLSDAAFEAAKGKVRSLTVKPKALG